MTWMEQESRVDRERGASPGSQEEHHELNKARQENAWRVEYATGGSEKDASVRS